jgi:hypothetical protein
MAPKSFYDIGSSNAMLIDSCLPMADVNGDGLPDVVCDFQLSKGRAGHGYYVGINTGCGWVKSSEYKGPETCAHPLGTLSNEVKTFLRKHGLSKYEANFDEHEIDMEVIADLTESDLAKMGIYTVGGRKKVLKALKKLPQHLLGTC